MSETGRKPRVAGLLRLFRGLVPGNVAAAAGRRAIPALPPSPRYDRRQIEAASFVVFDLETTGLDPQRGDEIVEIGAVRIEPGLRLEEIAFDLLLNPGRRIPPRATRVHGISDAMVAGRPGVHEGLARFRAFVGEAVLAAHSADLDLGFLRHHPRFGFGQLGQSLDTLGLSRALHPGHRDHSLDACLARHAIALPKRHRALPDARATAQLLLALLPLARERGARTVADLQRLGRVG